MGLCPDYPAITDYGVVGNCRTAALVSREGAVEWLCLPRFDSPSVFAAVLDRARGGRFLVRPLGPFSSRQRYLGDTNILVTEFTTPGGVCTVTDFLPLYIGPSGPVVRDQLVRLVGCRAGEVALEVVYEPRPDYARAPAHLVREGGAVVWKGDGECLRLVAPVPLQVSPGCARGRLRLRQGEETVLVLSYTGPGAPDLGDPPPGEMLARTRAFWEGKVARLHYSGRWREAVVRSYLVLHLLTDLDTGAVVAAPTTSLPEWPGGERNWDYRYCWLRDSALTVEALLALGHDEEARGFFRWLRGVCTECALRSHIQIMFRVDGGEELGEEVLEHLEGYCRSRPVRVGNGAYRQTQQDIYGDVLNTAYFMVLMGETFPPPYWDLVRFLARVATEQWQAPGSGIWEVRGGPFHFVFSKVMCWVALDRAARMARLLGREGPESRAWARTAEAIRAEVLGRGWNPRLRSFVQHYDTEAVDASLLVLPLVGFIPARDPRMVSTVERIRRELGPGPLLRRYLPEQTEDGLEGPEGAFTLCSFWLVRTLARLGAVEEACSLFEQLLGYSSPLGLFSEMVDPATGEALGNYPQGFTHLGLVLAAVELDRALRGLPPRPWEEEGSSPVSAGGGAL